MKELDRAQLCASAVLNILGIGLLCLPQYGASGLTASAAALGTALLCAFMLGSLRLESKILIFMFFVKSLTEGAMLLRIFEEFIALVLLPDTAKYLTGGILILCLMLGISGGIKPPALAARLVMPFVAAALVLCTLLSAVKTDVSRILPSDTAELSVYIKTAAVSVLMFYPLELAYFVRRKSCAGTLAAAVLISGIPIFAAAAVWRARFNYPTAFPILDLTYNGDFSAAFMRGLEAVLVCLITTAVYFSSGIAICTAAVCTGRPKGFMPVLCALAVYILGLIPADLESAKSILYITMIFGDGLFLIVLPIIMHTQRILRKTICHAKENIRRKQHERLI